MVKRKGFLKKFIGVLCAGILMCMPLTANAAEMKDVVGKWIGGGWQFVIFDENGQAEDFYNKRDYHIESGSLQIKTSSGATETMQYDLWRGERIENVPVDEQEDAVIYKIIGSGKMWACNVVKEKGQSDWTAPFGTAIITKEEVKASRKSSGSSSRKKSTKTNVVAPAPACEHYYEWKITTEPTETEDGVSSYMCISCGDVMERQPISAAVVIRNDILASIKNAEEGATVTFNNESWLCYPQYVLDALKEKGDVSLKTDFTYEGINYSFTIPAGSDYTNLEEADFYGFMYLYGAFDGTVVE